MRRAAFELGLAWAGSIVGACALGLLLAPSPAEEPPRVAWLSPAAALVPGPHPPVAAPGAPGSAAAEVDSGEVVVVAPATALVDLPALAAGCQTDAGQAALQTLVAQARNDPALRDDLLARFRQAEGETLWILGAALGKVRDPEVEAVALDMLRHPDAASRCAAFDVLDALDTPAALEPALEALARDGDPRVRRAALFALPEPRGSSSRAARLVVRSLDTILRSDPDPETRRRAALAVASWSPSTTALSSVLEALAHDPDASVRAGAAFALERSGRRDLEVQEALAAALGRPGEARLVRENAWRALAAQGPLPEALAQAYQGYAEERVAWLEVEGQRSQDR